MKCFTRAVYLKLAHYREGAPSARISQPKLEYQGSVAQ